MDDVSDFNNTVDKIMSQLGGLNVEMIFGESRQIGDKVVIPVGTIGYGWGGGGGKGPVKQNEPEAGPEGEGAGVGMGVKVKPLGFITVTADRVKYEPIIDMGPVILIFGVVFGLTLLKLSKMMMGKTMMGLCGWGKFAKQGMFGKHGKFGKHGMHARHFPMKKD